MVKRYAGRYDATISKMNSSARVLYRGDGRYDCAAVNDGHHHNKQDLHDNLRGGQELIACRIARLMANSRSNLALERTLQ